MRLESNIKERLLFHLKNEEIEILNYTDTQISLIFSFVELKP